MNYEFAYTNKFIRFADKNKDSQRDLIIALFENLYSDYPIYTD